MTMADVPRMPSDFAFHHVGYATRSIDRESPVFESLGYRIESPDFEDGTQGVRGRFLVGNGPRVELLENLAGRTTLDVFLDAGIRAYHFAYEVDAMVDALAFTKSSRAKLTVAPVPAVAFAGRLIAFAVFRNGLIVEWIERTTTMIE